MTHLMDLVGEFSCLLVVDGVRVEHGAEGLEIGLLLQQRDEVVRVGGETRWDYFTGLPFDIVRLENTTRLGFVQQINLKCN